MLHVQIFLVFDSCHLINSCFSTLLIQMFYIPKYLSLHFLFVIYFLSFKIKCLIFCALNLHFIQQLSAVQIKHLQSALNRAV